jgi:hypothetical protein
MPFVPKFCPVKFGWENALMLNSMQQIYEYDTFANCSAHGGSLFYDGERSPIYGSMLYNCHFSEPSGTVADADRLSLRFLNDRYAISYHITSDVDNLRAAESAQIFTVGVNGTSLLLDEGVWRKWNVLRSVRHLRKDLSERFFFVDPKVETSVFPPSRYGHRNALLLNGLQQIELLGEQQADNHQLESVFTRPSGTEFEADFLSFHYHDLASRVCDLLFHTGASGSSFKRVFLIDDKMHYWQAEQAINQELTLLRAGLFTIPRFTAFMMVRHPRLGAGSSLAALGDDVCRIILALSIK